MLFSAVLNILILKTSLISIFTTDLKSIFFTKNVHSNRPSLFKMHIMNPFEVKLSKSLKKFFSFKSVSD